MMSSHMVNGLRVIFTPSWSVSEKAKFLDNLEYSKRWCERMTRREGHAWVLDPGQGVVGQTDRDMSPVEPRRFGW